MNPPAKGPRVFHKTQITHLPKATPLSNAAPLPKYY